MRSVRSTPVVSPVAHDLLLLDLPLLPRDHRVEVVTFACRRIDALPGPIKVGVLAVASLVRALVALPGGHRLLIVLAGHPLPLVGEYFRLLRSLSTAYVWETWPDTAPDGART
jgi:hypothetical protein